MPKRSELKVSKDAARVRYSPTNSVGMQRTRFLLSCSMTFLREARAIDNCSLSARFFLDSCPRKRHLGRTMRDISKEEHACGPWNENYVHRDSRARNALQFHERRASKIHLAVCDRGGKVALVIIETPSSGKKGAWPLVQPRT